MSDRLLMGRNGIPAFEQCLSLHYYPDLIQTAFLVLCAAPARARCVSAGMAPGKSQHPLTMLHESPFAVGIFTPQVVPSRGNAEPFDVRQAAKEGNHSLMKETAYREVPLPRVFDAETTASVGVKMQVDKRSAALLGNGFPSATHFQDLGPSIGIFVLRVQKNLDFKNVTHKAVRPPDVPEALQQLDIYFPGCFFITGAEAQFASYVLRLGVIRQTGKETPQPVDVSF